MHVQAQQTPYDKSCIERTPGSETLLDKFCSCSAPFSQPYVNVCKSSHYVCIAFSARRLAQIGYNSFAALNVEAVLFLHAGLYALSTPQTSNLSECFSSVTSSFNVLVTTLEKKKKRDP